MWLPGTPLLRPSFVKNGDFPCPNVWYTLTILFKAAASHLSLLNIPHFSYFGHASPKHCLCFSLYSGAQGSLFFLSLDTVASSMAWSCIRIRASPFPRRLPDTGQSLIEESKSICWPKNLGLNLSVI